MYIDPMIGIIRYEEDVRRAEERIRMLRELEERQEPDRTAPRGTPRPRRVGGLRTLLPRRS